MERILYISESCLERSDAKLEVMVIVKGSIRKNSVLDITGALLFTETHFAQILEGPSESLNDLMSTLRRDPRHKNVHVIDRTAIHARIFPNWQMAYFGPSKFVSRHVIALQNYSSTSERVRAVDRFTLLMSEFSTAQSA